MSLQVIILTYNEERHIARAIAAASQIADDILVVDSYSNDRTIELARIGGARVLQHPFVNYGQQFQWAIDNCEAKTNWIMRLDADEVIEPDLIDEIKRMLPQLGNDVAGVNLKLKRIFLGRRIRHGHSLTLLRIWRRNQGRIENRWMDEHMIVWGGSIVTFKGGFADCNLNDLTYFTDKHNKYATREAVDVLSRRHGLFNRDEGMSAESSPREVAFKRQVKEHIYNDLPIWLGPLAYFLSRYFFLLGFLDGREGLIYHYLQGFWYRFLVHAKVIEFEKALTGLHDPAKKREELERLTGLRLNLGNPR